MWLGLRVPVFLRLRPAALWDHWGAVWGARGVPDEQTGVAGCDGQKHQVLLGRRPLALSRGTRRDGSLAGRSQHAVHQEEPGAAGEPGPSLSRCLSPGSVPSFFPSTGRACLDPAGPRSEE